MKELGPFFERMSDFWQLYKRNKAAVLGLVVILFFSALAILAPILNLSSPFRSSASLLKEPRIGNPMGTDHLGRDVLSMVVWGSRTSLMIGFLSAALSAVIGTLMGAIPGYYGGIIDDFLMRIVDLLLVIPMFFLILLVVALFGGGIFKIVAVIGLLSWPSIARVVRGQFLTLKERTFVEAARAIGVKDRHIILRHILPNAIPPIVVNLTLQTGGAILTEASLSFLGLGDPTQISWGMMISDAQRFIGIAWWMAVFPSLALSIVVLALNLVGDGLTDAINPRPPVRL